MLRGADTPSRSALHFADTQPWPGSPPPAPHFPVRPLASKCGQFLIPEEIRVFGFPPWSARCWTGQGRGSRTPPGEAARGPGTGHPRGGVHPISRSPQQPPPSTCRPGAASALGAELTGRRRRAGLFKRPPRSAPELGRLPAAPVQNREAGGSCSAGRSPPPSPRGAEWRAPEEPLPFHVPVSVPSRLHLERRV